MPHAAPLVLHRATVLPEWVDYNGHMNEAYYVLVFGHATDAFLDYIGMDDAARRATGSSVYTLEAHINYLAEDHQGDHLAIATQLLAHDAKRLHLHHVMQREADGAMLAAIELMLLHVDMSGPRAFWPRDGGLRRRDRGRSCRPAEAPACRSRHRPPLRSCTDRT